MRRNAFGAYAFPPFFYCALMSRPASWTPHSERDPHPFDIDPCFRFAGRSPPDRRFVGLDGRINLVCPISGTRPEPTYLASLEVPGPDRTQSQHHQAGRRQIASIAFTDVFPERPVPNDNTFLWLCR